MDIELITNRERDIAQVKKYEVLGRTAQERGRKWDLLKEKVKKSVPMRKECELSIGEKMA